MSALVWRNVTPSNSPKFLVKGTELNAALCGHNSRYQICEIRCYDMDGFPDRYYAVRDADTVSDFHVKMGTRPLVVARFDNLDEAIQFCLKNN